MAPSSDPSYVHIPAWKKLGLKLKYAKEDAEDLTAHRDEQTEATNVKKRKLADVANSSTPQSSAIDVPGRKPKKTKTNRDGSTSNFDGDEVLVPSTKDKASSPPSALRTPNAVRKSVSFTPETKTQDGEGIKQLYKAWLDKQVAIDSTFNPSIISPALRSIEPATTTSDEAASRLHPNKAEKAVIDSNPSPKKAKKSRSEKKPEKSETSSPTSAEKPSPIDHPALTYLTTHHTSPSDWKFSKSCQNYLLKHLFSLTHLPPSYDLAILNYLRGIQGSARSRIRQQALVIRLEDSDWLSSEPSDSEKMDQETNAQCMARRKRDYDAAVARVKQQLRDQEDEREDREWELLGDREEWEQRVKKRRRAEVVLWSVGEHEEVVEATVPLPKHAVFRNSRPTVHEPTTIQSRGMGGVKEISIGGIAKGSASKKIVFDENGANGVQNVRSFEPPNGVEKAERMNGVNGVHSQKRHGNRKRGNKKRTSVPDDDSSTSESSSSEESEVEKKEVPNNNFQRGYFNARANLGDDTSSSESGSESGDSSVGSNSN